jgi:hypothetical protein
MVALVTGLIWRKMNNLTSESADLPDTWDKRTQAGTKRLRARWASLQPSTKKILMKDGFDNAGSLSSPLESWHDSSSLAYSLGLFEEAAKGSIPSKKEDVFASYYLSDEVLQEAANLVLTREHCDPEFTRLALHACMKHQAVNAAYRFLSNGGKRAGVRSGWGVIGYLVAWIFFSVLLAACIGNGLSLAFDHDAAGSSVLAFVAMFSYGTMKNLNKPHEASKEEVANDVWSSVFYNDFHIGTGHGVERQLQDLLRQGRHVPSVLFDLCAALQQGTAYRPGKVTNLD